MSGDWRLPRSTGDLFADWMLAARAYSTATTDAQRDAVLLRARALSERQQAGEPMGPIAAVMRDIAVMAEAWVAQIRQAVEAVLPAFVEAARCHVPEEDR